MASLDEPSNPEKEGAKLLSRVPSNGLDFSRMPGRPQKKIFIIRDDFDPLVKSGIPIPMLQKELQAVGIVCSERTVRRYIQRYMPDIYKLLYERAPCSASLTSAESVDSADRIETRAHDAPGDKQQGSISQGDKALAAKKCKSTVYAEERRVRASPEAIFGENALEEFSFLKPQRDENE